MLLPHKRLIPGIIVALMIDAIAAPPLWWTDEDTHVIPPGAIENNNGPANIGQAKHMVKSALDALRPILPDATTQIEADLVPIINLTVPEPKPPDWTDKQKAPLLIGQLKAIAHPFYTRLNAAAPEWLEAECAANGTNHPGSIFPWTTEISDDQNIGIANIGQLKAVFSLRFEKLPPPIPADSDSDGMPDLWEIEHGLDPNNSSDADQDLDSDGMTNLEEFMAGADPRNPDTDSDGMPDKWEIANGLDPIDDSDSNSDIDEDNLTAHQELVRNTNPNIKDTDIDGIDDSIDAVGNDAEINWEMTPESKYVWIEQVTKTGARSVSRHGHILFPTSNGGSSNLYDLQVLWDSATSSWVDLTGENSWSDCGFWNGHDWPLGNSVFNPGWVHIDNMNDDGIVVGRSESIGNTIVAIIGANAIMRWQRDGIASNEYADPIYIVPGFEYVDPWYDLKNQLLGNSPKIADDGTISAIAFQTSPPDESGANSFHDIWVASPPQLANHSTEMSIWASFLSDPDWNTSYEAGLSLDSNGGLLVERDRRSPKMILHYRYGDIFESLEGIIPNYAQAIIPTDIGRTPETYERTGGRIWFSLYHNGGLNTFIEKCDGGSGVSRWHNPPSMDKGAIRINTRGEAITPGRSATQTDPAIAPNIWRNGKYADLNDENLTSKPSSVTITNAIDLASNGIILAEAVENGVRKTGLLVPFGIDGYRRGTINAPGVKVSKGAGEYAQETVMMENANSEDNATKPDYETTAVDANNDDDLVKVVLHWPKDLKINGVKIELKHIGMEVDPTKTSDADIYKETGPSRLNFYKPDGTKLTDAHLKIDDLGSPGTGYLAEILTTGKLTLFVEGAEKFGLVGNDPNSATAAEKLGGAMLNFEVTQNETINRARLLIYRGGFLVYRMPKVSPPLPPKGVLGTLEFWDGKGRVKHVFGGKGKEFKEDETHWGTQLKSWPARSGRVNGKDYDIENGSGHVPPGWWIVYPVDLTKKPFVYPQPNRWEKDAKDVSYLRQGAYNRWSTDDETDPSKRYTYDYKFYPKIEKDAAIGNPSQTSIMFKFDLDPIKQTKAQNRKGIQIHPDGECSDSVMGGTAGCIGLQTYSSCKEVYNWLSAYKGIKIKVLRE